MKLPDRLGLIARFAASMLFALGVLWRSDPSYAQAVDVIVRLPEDTESILKNPHMGWETNNRTRPSARPRAGVPHSSVAYFKYYLGSFLRSDGRIDLRRLEDDVKRSTKSGQKIAFRLMIYGEEQGGEILKKLGVKAGTSYYYDDGRYRGKRHWAPNLDDPKALRILDRLLRSIGKRYDGHPNVSHVDIGLVGLWGEWQTHDTFPLVPMPSEETQRTIIDMHIRAFPRTRTLMQVQDPAMLRYALDRGAGMRADCLAAAETTMMQRYPQTIAAAQADAAWQTAPFVFEICWKFDEWRERGWDSNEVFAIALEHYRVSAINTKSSRIPEGMRIGFDDFLRRIGYRFVLREARYPSEVFRGNGLPTHLLFDNVGVAPCYDDFRLLLKFSRKGRSERIVPLGGQLCGQLPGTFSLDPSTAALEDIEPGVYSLSLGVAEKSRKRPSIYLANTGEQKRWYHLGEVTLH